MISFPLLTQNSSPPANRCFTPQRDGDDKERDEERAHGGEVQEGNFRHTIYPGKPGGCGYRNTGREKDIQAFSVEISLDDPFHSHPDLTGVSL